MTEPDPAGEPGAQRASEPTGEALEAGPPSLSAQSLAQRPTEPGPAPQAPAARSSSVATLSASAAQTLPGDVESRLLRRSGRFSLDDAQPDDPAPRADPLIGVVVAGRYRILELLGRGGMGIVYKVQHTSIGKLLAMKLLTGELSRSSEVVRRFKHEALTASKLSSANTVQVFDYGVSDGLTYLVMELVTGDDLGRVLKQEGALPPASVARILVQIASSLAEAHHHGIVHRDIKPENVMLVRGRDGTEIAKVLDFGLAKLRESSELNELTSQGAIVGTPYFMSPEQIKGEPVDPRSDVYSLGALAYRALTGQYPFQGPSPMSVFAKHLTETPAPPHELDPSIPVALGEVVMRALAKEPSDRFQRVEDFRAAVLDSSTELGASGDGVLVDSGELRRLATADAKSVELDPLPIATRDQVEAYERSLRRQRAFGTALGLLLPLGLVGGGVHYAFGREVPVVYGGVETEPNDDPATANALPFGDQVRAHLGRRRSETQSDVDFYAVDVPSSPVAVSLQGLPNMAVCLQIYTSGVALPLPQYCPGRPGLPLELPELRLEPGSYHFAVLQDLDPRGSATRPFVHENVSDAYVLAIRAAVEDESRESEPNDSQRAADLLLPEQTKRGSFAWVGDVDVYCPAGLDGGRWALRVEDGARSGGAVLGVAPIHAHGLGAATRVHASGRAPDKGPDVKSPWLGPTFSGDEAPCFQLELTLDPQHPGVADAVLVASPVEYALRLEPVQ